MLRAYENSSEVTESNRSTSSSQTLELGALIGAGLRAGDLVLLRGPLGAGKTTFAAGVGAALGIRRWRGSPTFALINEYSTDPVLVHVDLYRLGEADMDGLGLEEYADRGAVMLVEWPERAPSHLLSLGFPRVLEVDLDIAGENARDVRIQRRNLSVS